MDVKTNHSALTKGLAVSLLVLFCLAFPAAGTLATIAIPKLNPLRAVTGSVPVILTGVEVKRLRGQTRVLLSADGPVPYRIFTLADPYRIIVDVPEVPFKLGKKARAEARGLVKTLRYGFFRPGNARIVIDLTEPALIAKVTHTAGDGDEGHHVAIDLIPAKRKTFLKIAGWPDAAEQSSGFEAKTISLIQSARVLRPAPNPRQRAAIVVIDPGHGGIDPGTSTKHGTEEKQITLLIAQQLKRILTKEYGLTVKLTRERDVFVSLRDRVKLARSEGADLFVSLHADSLEKTGVNGLGVYTLSENASNGEAEELARQENRSDIIAGVDLGKTQDEVASILINLAQRETNNTSISFAKTLVTNIKNKIPIIPRPVRQAGFRVLKAPDVPSILIELGFLSNKVDEERLTSPKGQRELAGLIAGGITNWLKIHRPNGFRSP